MNRIQGESNENLHRPNYLILLGTIFRNNMIIYRGSLMLLLFYTTWGSQRVVRGESNFVETLPAGTVCQNNSNWISYAQSPLFSNHCTVSVMWGGLCDSIAYTHKSYMYPKFQWLRLYWLLGSGLGQSSACTHWQSGTALQPGETGSSCVSHEKMRKNMPAHANLLPAVQMRIFKPSFSCLWNLRHKISCAWGTNPDNVISLGK